MPFRAKKDAKDLVGASCYLAIAQEGDLWLPWPISYQPQQRVSVVHREEQLGLFKPPRRARGSKNDELERRDAKEREAEPPLLRLKTL